MRAAAYLSHGLALRQTADPNICNAAIGHPGAVYICRGPGSTDCKWFDFPMMQTCQVLSTLGGTDFSKPTLIGPDFGVSSIVKIHTLVAKSSPRAIVICILMPSATTQKRWNC